MVGEPHTFLSLFRIDSLVFAVQLYIFHIVLGLFTDPGLGCIKQGCRFDFRQLKPDSGRLEHHRVTYTFRM